MNEFQYHFLINTENYSPTNLQKYIYFSLYNAHATKINSFNSYQNKMRLLYQLFHWVRVLLHASNVSFAWGYKLLLTCFCSYLNNLISRYSMFTWGMFSIKKISEISLKSVLLIIWLKLLLQLNQKRTEEKPLPCQKLLSW